MRTVGVSDVVSRLLRRLPAVDRVLADPDVKEWLCRRGYGQDFSRRAVNHFLGRIRHQILDGAVGEEELEARLAEPVGGVRDAATVMLRPQLQSVINATGVVVHTNLGRAPWSAAAAERVATMSQRYLNLEFDLQEGRRGHRDRPVERMVRQLFPETAVAVVNNNAAAVLLVLNTFAEGREVAVSRGQLVEIGGSFRIPEVMTKGQCRLLEVGTTNRTRAEDFRRAIGPDTALLMAVHPSNYRLVGFTESVPLAELAKIGRERGIPVIEDLGSGTFVELGAVGIADEPTVAERLETGVDLVTFSGDKLMGGPQAGFIVGKPEAVERVRANPLYRALRLDKTIYLALEATLSAYVSGQPQTLPVLGMVMQPLETLRLRAQQLVNQLCQLLASTEVDVELVAVGSRVGGGAAPGMDLPSHAAAIRSSLSPDSLSRRLRNTEPPVIVRIADDRVLLDVRTVLPGEEAALVGALVQALAEK